MNHDNRNPTMREVAQKASVCLMTVSRVMNDDITVHPARRRRVLAAAAEIGYQQNDAARMLKGPRSKTIGLIVPDLSDTFFATCAHTIQQVARSKGHMTLVASSECSPEREIEQATLMASRKIAGLLIVTSVTSGNPIRSLQKDGLSIVAFDCPLDGVDTDTIVVENKLGAEEAVGHLIGHGHSKIACVGYHHEAYTVSERIRGYRNSMLAAGLKPVVSPAVQTIEATRAWLTFVLKTTDRPTAIFSLNNRTSMHLLRLLPEMRLRVPQDVALIGFDDFELADMMTPALTAVAQCPTEMAQRASALLFERIANKDNRGCTPAKVVLPVRLIIRNSCGCVS